MKDRTLATLNRIESIQSERAEESDPAHTDRSEDQVGVFADHLYQALDCLFHANLIGSEPMEA